MVIKKSGENVDHSQQHHHVAMFAGRNRRKSFFVRQSINLMLLEIFWM